MPTYVDPDKCDGCRALERPACMYICPMDLMKLDTETGKGFNHDRVLSAECHLRHVLHRKETRWPGYLCRPDYATFDDENWKLFVTSRHDSGSGGRAMSTKPLIRVIE